MAYIEPTQVRDVVERDLLSMQDKAAMMSESTEGLG